jgi:hypothetical protein
MSQIILSIAFRTVILTLAVFFAGFIGIRIKTKLQLADKKEKVGKNTKIVGFFHPNW